jgi:hypothetical protein
LDTSGKESIISEEGTHFLCRLVRKIYRVSHSRTSFICHNEI